MPRDFNPPPGKWTINNLIKEKLEAIYFFPKILRGLITETRNSFQIAACIADRSHVEVPQWLSS